MDMDQYDIEFREAFELIEKIRTLENQVCKLSVVQAILAERERLNRNLSPSRGRTYQLPQEIIDLLVGRILVKTDRGYRVLGFDLVPCSIEEYLEKNGER